ncbi:hypothetical protein E4T38_06881 [Aureobasidium subglaciale]|nr:hypothetical protein E4T38_06881 [Aureobasidium subglaciale]KAI5218520.1 hypothetical protein E4T40_06812 [Aureobasidium subglaciale]KAI5222147.1 hypothetical protein E4T41_06732 [Aureobasidium subglaciale]KAI5259640.1 hypothetical protein E4T46_06710 [Aureobasidium subglaciale]
MNQSELKTRLGDSSRSKAGSKTTKKGRPEAKRSVNQSVDIRDVKRSVEPRVELPVKRGKKKFPKSDGKALLERITRKEKRNAQQRQLVCECHNAKLYEWVIGHFQDKDSGQFDEQGWPIFTEERWNKWWKDWWNIPSASEYVKPDDETLMHMIFTEAPENRHQGAPWVFNIEGELYPRYHYLQAMLAMNIPSSPPALPDDVFNEPPSSPPLAPAEFPSRKRHAGWEYDSSMSSDPIFSEDASEESEVTGTKRKRFVRGPWYQHAHSPAMSRVRAGGRKGDSGVWLGSDSSTDSIGSSSRRVQSLTFNEYMQKGAPLTQRQTPTKPKDSVQERAASIVFNSVDNCKDSIDLSDMHLGRLDNETLKPLHQLIRLPVPINDSQKITDDHFAPLTPSIKLFLSRNELQQLPPELWNLGNMAVLSLRSNALIDISPSIGRLRNLHELNVAGNQLPYLPFELLSLIQNKLVQLSLSPNPFVHPLPLPTSNMLRSVPSKVDDCLRELRRLRSRCPDIDASEPSHEALLHRLYASRLYMASQGIKSTSTYVASSSIAYFEIDGAIVRSPFRSYTAYSGPNYSASFSRPSPPSSTRSAAPSLFELSARACARSQYVGQLSTLLPEDVSPPVNTAIGKVLESKEVGMQHCSVCNKQFLVPRAQWVEYYYVGPGGEMCSPSELLRPFLRRACSWVCVDRLTVQREQHWEDCEKHFQDLTRYT